MQTSFTLAQLNDPDVAESEKILRACVHCGFCTATCPTYVLLGDELDSPRGRIYLIKDMLENGKPATAKVVKHIDRCLSCLSCMTTCPSGVHYMHLVDHARRHIEQTFRRPRIERWLRSMHRGRPAQARRCSAWPSSRPGWRSRWRRCCRRGCGRCWRWRRARFPRRRRSIGRRSSRPRARAGSGSRCSPAASSRWSRRRSTRRPFDC